MRRLIQLFDSQWLTAFFCICLPAMAFFSSHASAQPPLRQSAAQRGLLIGAAVRADEFNDPNLLDEPGYAATLAAQFNMLGPENALKWNPIRPTQSTFNFGPPDKLLAFAEAHGMKARGHTLVWHEALPTWLSTYAATATPAQMSALLQEHIATLMGRYKGRIFAWDVVNEAVPDTASGDGIALRDSIWHNKPGIGPTGVGYIEQAFRWAHAADPDALLFYNDYGIEGPVAKFRAVYNLVKELIDRGTPIHGVGLQMHVTTSGFPDAAGLSQVIRQFTDLGLQVQITEMDVRIPVNSSGVAALGDLQAQAAVYNRVMTACLQNAGCTAVQFWGFTDKHSWIPGSYPGYGAGLPFDLNYQPKITVDALLGAMQGTPPTLSTAGIVNAASYKGGPVAPGEFITIFGANYGPPSLRMFTLNGDTVAVDPAMPRVLFDGIPAPIIYARAGQLSVVVPFEVAGKSQTVVEYEFNSVRSSPVTLPVAGSAPGIFTYDASGSGPAAVLDANNLLNSAANPAGAGQALVLFATGGGLVQNDQKSGGVAPGAANQRLAVTATIGGVPAQVLYAGAAPGLVNGVMQVNVVVPAGLAAGAQPVVLTVNDVPSQTGVTVAVR